MTVRASLVLLLLVLLNPLSSPVHAAQANAAGFVTPLSTRGRYIVDANGVRVKLKSGN